MGNAALGFVAHAESKAHQKEKGVKLDWAEWEKDMCG